jgi:hypothetical protein
MGFEAEGEPQAMTITACDAPRHLGLRSESEWGVWHLEAHLSETAGVTELRFVHHLDGKTKVGDVGPGWEYYLDNLVASREGRPPVDFNDYYPAQSAYFMEQEGELAQA